MNRIQKLLRTNAWRRARVQCMHLGHDWKTELAAVCPQRGWYVEECAVCGLRIKTCAHRVAGLGDGGHGFIGWTHTGNSSRVEL